MTTRSAFYNLHCTHTAARPDAVIYNGREFVPTANETVWVDTLAQLRAVKGDICWNEDQTEVWLRLPAGHKFSCLMFRAEDALRAFVEQVARMTTDQEAGGDMSGDDAASALSGLIEQARAMVQP